MSSFDRSLRTKLVGLLISLVVLSGLLWGGGDDPSWPLGILLGGFVVVLGGSVAAELMRRREE